MATWTVTVRSADGSADHEVRVDAADAAHACDLAALDLRGSGVGGPTPHTPGGGTFAAEREEQLKDEQSSS